VSAGGSALFSPKEEAMKVLKFILVVICAAVLLRLAACTTGLAPTPNATPEKNPVSTPPQSPEEQPAGPEQENESIPTSDPAKAREAALTYLLAEIPEAGNEAEEPATIDWSVEDVTPPNLVGSVSTLYEGGGWRVLVRYPVVAPANIRYTVEIQNLSTGSTWEVILDANFQVLTLNQLTP
jgi:hypothetical protein